MMAAPFSPRLDILPGPQRTLWGDLSQIPAGFVLYGGTALALHLGHRQSVDFDFFSMSAIDPDSLLLTIPILKNARVTQKALNTLDAVVRGRGRSVKLSFFGLPTLRQMRQPHVCPGNGLLVASLLDLAGTKVAVVQQRSELKDYLDVAAIIADGGISLSTALSAAAIIYGKQFNPQISLKALAYFGDGDLALLPERSRATLLDAVRGVDLLDLPALRARRSSARSVRHDKGVEP